MRSLRLLAFVSLWLGLQFRYLPTTKAETRLTQSNWELERVNTELLCPQDIAREIKSIINSPQLARSNWGILVKNLDSQTTIYSLNAHKYFIPASNVKLLITAAALSELGNNFRIHTPIYSVGNAPNLTQIRVQGKGDPTISTETLKKIVEQLKQKGIKHIEKLIVDNSYFNQPTINPTWEWSDLYNSYATSVSSLILNNNAVTLTLLPQELGQPVKLMWSDDIAARQWQVKNNVITAEKDTPYNVEIDGILGQPILHLNGTLAINHQSDLWDLAIVDPANYFLESLRHLLSLEGITVTRGLVSNEVAVGSAEIELATIISPTLPEILAEINQESNNLYAEALLKILANQLKINDVSQAVEQVLSKLGIDPQDYNLVDGSGLSRHNLITPETLVQTLSLMKSTSVGENYLNSLTTAGVNGTLENRFLEQNFAGNILGKTGTLSGINSLSGYLNLSEAKTLVFSIIVNNSDLSSKNLRQAIDQIVRLFSRVKQC